MCVDSEGKSIESDRKRKHVCMLQQKKYIFYFFLYPGTPLSLSCLLNLSLLSFFLEPWLCQPSETQPLLKTHQIKNLYWYSDSVFATFFFSFYFSYPHPMMMNDWLSEIKSWNTANGWFFAFPTPLCLCWYASLDWIRFYREAATHFLWIVRF